MGTGLGWGAVSEWETFWEKVSPQAPLQKLLTRFIYGGRGVIVPLSVDSSPHFEIIGE